MKAILRFLQRESRWPLVVLVIGMLFLLPGLGSYGFWEPQEIGVADQARERLDASGAPGETADEAPAEAEGAAADRAKPDQGAADRASSDPAPPLTVWSVGQGIGHVQSSELGARLPLALLGLGAVLAAFFLGLRLASPRAGLFSALILLACPLVLFQSRQLMSDIGAVTGSAVLMLGLVGLAWPDRNRPPWAPALDVVLVILGAALSYYGAAAFLGLVVPFGAVGLACLASLHNVAGAAAAANAHVPAGDPSVDGPRRGAMAAGLLVLGLGLGVAMSADVLDLGRPARLGLGLLPACAGALLFLYGLLAPRMRAPQDAAARREHRRLLVAGTISALVALAALAVVFYQAFSLKGPIPGERALFGFSLVPVEEPSRALGGVWKLRDNLSATFDSLFEQIAYGMFPWSAVAPIALLHLAMTGARRGRRAWAGIVPVAWAVAAWVVAAVMVRKVGPVLYPAPVALAVATGMWLDDLMAARQQADATAESEQDARQGFGVPLHLPLVAIFVLLGVVVLGKDLLAFPERVTSLTVLDGSVAYPNDLKVLWVPAKAWFLVFGVLFGGALACSLWLWHRHRRRGEQRDPLSAALHLASRYGIHAALGVGLLSGLLLIHGWIPAMSQKLSSKHIFSVYRDLRQDGDRLGLMGNPGSGVDYYAGTAYEKLANRQSLLAFLEAPERVFALAPASELCAIHRAVKGDRAYHVLDDSNAKFLLLSNRLQSGERDLNPLARAITREEPTDIQTRLKVDYDGRVELIGVNMPAEVARGSSFEMTLFYRVKRPVGGSWKIFVHFDGSGLRFQGDHTPINDRCSTTYWQAGDYIIDTFTVDAGDVTYAKGSYAVLTGFFRGSHGNWTNMPVESATGPAGQSLPVGQDQRVRIGQIRVR